MPSILVALQALGFYALFALFVITGKRYILGRSSMPLGGLALGAGFFFQERGLPRIWVYADTSLALAFLLALSLGSTQFAIYLQNLTDYDRPCHISRSRRSAVVGFLFLEAATLGFWAVIGHVAAILLSK